MQHPFGIEPWGNFLFKGGPNIRDAGGGVDVTTRIASALRPAFYPCMCMASQMCAPSPSRSRHKVERWQRSRDADVPTHASHSSREHSLHRCDHACLIPCRSLAGLGTLSVLGDALLLEIVGLLGPRDLGCLALASKSLYCFANQEEIWKGLVIEVWGLAAARAVCGSRVVREVVVLHAQGGQGGGGWRTGVEGRRISLPFQRRWYG